MDSEEPDAKRARGMTAHPDDMAASDGPVEAEWFIEQRLVGWIIGKSGATLKEVEAAYDVKVVVDQGTKAEGFSKVIVAGPSTNVHNAADHMNTSLARANGDSSGEVSVGPFLLDTPPTVETDLLRGGPDAGSEEMTIEQRFVGWLLGRGGGVVREIEQESGCKVSINQETRAQGYSILQLYGNAVQREQARGVIDASLQRAGGTRGGPPPMAGGKGLVPRGAAAKGGQPMFTLRGGGASSAAGFTVTIGGAGKGKGFMAAGCGGKGGGAAGQEQIQIEQKWVGWLLGKGGGLCREIEQECGCRIKIDQSTRDQGFSTVRIEGQPAQVASAKQLILGKLSQVGGAPVAGSAGETTMQVQVEQKWVGWLLGKSGSVLKEMEFATGAKISINQDTKQEGYSVAVISGTTPQIQSAYALMYEKIAQVDPQAADSGLVQLGTDPLTAESGLPQLGTSPGAGARGFVASALVTTPKAKGPVITIGSQTVELQVEQRWVGWLLGSGGKTIKQMEATTGCRIACDQNTKDLGYSLVKVTGPGSAVQAALDSIQSSLAMAEKGGHRGTDDLADAGAEVETFEMTVEQKKVGWLLGKGGVVLREIETTSGCRCSLDQSTKELGYSTVKISGSSHGIASAQQLIDQKLSQADGLS